MLKVEYHLVRILRLIEVIIIITIIRWKCGKISTGTKEWAIFFKRVGWGMYIAYTLIKRNHLPPSFIQTKSRTNWLSNLCLISFKKALFFRKLLHQPYHSITMKDKNQKCNFEFFLAFTFYYYQARLRNG